MEVISYREQIVKCTPSNFSNMAMFEQKLFS